MTQKDKKLLLLDLSARLPYGVKVIYKNGNIIYNLTSMNLGIKDIPMATYRMVDVGIESEGYIEDIKPLLRPMSSMTEEEKREFSIFIGKTETYRQQICLDSDSMCNPIIGGYKCVYWGLFDKCIDWLNTHHFDYRGLIEKGLALEAPEGMYNLNKK